MSTPRFRVLLELGAEGWVKGTASAQRAGANLSRGLGDLHSAYRRVHQIAALALGNRVVQDINATTVAYQRAAGALRIANQDLGDQGQIAEETTRQLAFFREEADRLGLLAAPLREQGAALLRTARGTELAGQAIVDVLVAIAEASTAADVSSEDFGGTLLAVRQIISKQKVSTEELLQIAERGIGDFNLFARAVGLTGAEFSDAVRKGEVLAKDFLPALARELRNTYGAAVEASAQNALSQFNRLRNAIEDVKLAVGENLTGALAEAAKALAQLLRTDEVKALAGAVGELAGNLRLLVGLFAAYLALNVPAYVAAITRAWVAFTLAVKANPIGLVLTAIVTAATAADQAISRWAGNSQKAIAGIVAEGQRLTSIWEGVEAAVNSASRATIQGESDRLNAQLVKVKATFAEANEDVLRYSDLLRLAATQSNFTAQETRELGRRMEESHQARGKAAAEIRILERSLGELKEALKTAKDETRSHAQTLDDELEPALEKVLDRVKGISDEDLGIKPKLEFDIEPLETGLGKLSQEILPELEAHSEAIRRKWELLAPAAVKVADAEREADQLAKELNLTLAQRHQIYLAILRESGAIADNDGKQQQVIDDQVDQALSAYDTIAQSGLDAFASVFDFGHDGMEQLVKSLLSIFVDYLRKKVAQNAAAEAAMRAQAQASNAGNAAGEALGGAGGASAGAGGADGAIASGAQDAAAAGTGTAATGAAVSAAGAAVAVFYFQQLAAHLEHAAARHARNYFRGFVGYDVEAGAASSSVTGNPYFTREQAAEVTATLDELFAGIAEAAGGFLLDVPQILVSMSESGDRFKVHVGAAFLGYFDSLDEALSQAAAFAASQGAFEGVSASVLRVLQTSAGVGAEELMHRLDVATRLDHVADLARDFAAFASEAQEVLAVVQATGIELGVYLAWKDRELQSLRDTGAAGLRAYSGIRSFGDGLERAIADAEAANAALERERAARQGQITATEQAIAGQSALDAQLAATGAGTVAVAQQFAGLTQASAGAVPSLDELRQQLAAHGTTLPQVTQAVGELGDALAPTGVTVADLTSDLEALQASLAEIPEAIPEREIQLAVDGAFSTLLRDLAELTGSEAARQELARISAQIEIESLRLRAAELYRLNRLTEAQVTLLDQLLGQAIGRLETTGLPSGGGGRRPGTVADAISQLQLPLDSVETRFHDLGVTLGFLAGAVERGRLSQERYAAVLDQVAQAVTTDALGLAQQLFERMGDSQAAAEIGHRLEEARFRLAVAELEITYRQAQALGLLDEASAQLIDQALAAAAAYTFPATPAPDPGGLDDTTRATLTLEEALSTLAPELTATTARHDAYTAALDRLEAGLAAGTVSAAQYAEVVAAGSAQIAGELSAQIFGWLDQAGLSAEEQAQALELRRRLERALFDAQILRMQAELTFWHDLGLLQDDAFADLMSAFALVQAHADEIFAAGLGSGGTGPPGPPPPEDLGAPDLSAAAAAGNAAQQLLDQLAQALGSTAGEVPRIVEEIAALRAEARELAAEFPALGTSLGAVLLQIDELLIQRLEPTAERLRAFITAGDEVGLSQAQSRLLALDQGYASATDSLRELIAALGSAEAVASEYGVTLEELTASYEAQRQAIYSGLLDPLEQIEQSLRLGLGGISTGSPFDQLAAARAAVTELLPRIAAGDVTALESLPGALQALLSVGGSFAGPLRDQAILLVQQAIAQARAAFAGGAGDDFPLSLPGLTLAGAGGSGGFLGGLPGLPGPLYPQPGPGGLVGGPQGAIFGAAGGAVAGALAGDPALRIDQGVAGLRRDVQHLEATVRALLGERLDQAERHDRHAARRHRANDPARVALGQMARAAETDRLRSSRR